MIESICKKIELFEEENGTIPSKTQLKEMIAEEEIKRNLL